MSLNASRLNGLLEGLSWGQQIWFLPSQVCSWFKSKTSFLMLKLSTKIQKICYFHETTKQREMSRIWDDFIDAMIQAINKIAKKKKWKKEVTVQ